MSLLDRLERHLGRWAIHDLPLFIVAANGAIYVLSLLKPAFPSLLYCDPDAIRAGQLWRLVTFLFIPPEMHPIWVVFWLYLLYLYAQGLEQEWGPFRFNVFYGLGALATLLVAFFAVHGPVSNVPLNTTLFLAFAAIYPRFEILLFFILSVKVKWIAYALWAWIGWALFKGDVVTRMVWAAALTNYFLFFGPRHWGALRLRLSVWRNRRRW